MPSEEFSRHTFTTERQWQSGVAAGTEYLGSGGIALLRRPTFAGWLTQAPEARNALGVALDRAGTAFWIDPHDGTLYRWSEGCERPESLFPGRGPAERGESARSRPAVGRYLLWLADPDGARLRAFSSRSMQILREVETEDPPLDLAVGVDDGLWVLDRSGVYHLDRLGREDRRFPLPDGVRALGLARVERSLFIAVADRPHVLRYELDDPEPLPAEVGWLTPSEWAGIGACGDASLAFIEPSGERLQLIAPDGTSLGPLAFPNAGSISAVSSGSNQMLVGTASGIAIVALRPGAGDGEWYSPALDSGANARHHWHRVDLEHELPPSTTLSIQYALGDEEQHARISQALAGASSPSEAAEIVRRRLDWSAQQTFGDTGEQIEPPESGSDEIGFSSLLVEDPDDTGLSAREPSAPPRYLWVRATLHNFGGTAQPVVRRLTAVRPRLTYLRYLPEVYQHDDNSRRLLERLLSTFETVFEGIERKIDRLWRYFDSRTTPPEFLDWLGGWMNLAFDEGWSEQRKRLLIEHAHELFRLRGTPRGLFALFELAADLRPVLIEGAQLPQPAIVGDQAGRLGYAAVGGAPNTPFRIGRGAVLSRATLRAEPAVEEPLSAYSDAVTVVLPLSQTEFERRETTLRRLLSEALPAHVRPSIRLVRGGGLEVSSTVGINFELEDARPIQLGVDARLGSIVALHDREWGSLLGSNASVGLDLRLN